MSFNDHRYFFKHNILFNLLEQGVKWKKKHMAEEIDMFKSHIIQKYQSQNKLHWPGSTQGRATTLRERHYPTFPMSEWNFVHVWTIKSTIYAPYLITLGVGWHFAIWSVCHAASWFIWFMGCSWFKSCGADCMKLVLNIMFLMETCSKKTLKIFSCLVDLCGKMTWQPLCHFRSTAALIDLCTCRQRHSQFTGCFVWGP